MVRPLLGLIAAVLLVIASARRSPLQAAASRLHSRPRVCQPRNFKDTYVLDYFYKVTQSQSPNGVWVPPPRPEPTPENPPDPSDYPTTGDIECLQGVDTSNVVTLPPPLIYYNRGTQPLVVDITCATPLPKGTTRLHQQYTFNLSPVYVPEGVTLKKRLKFLTRQLLATLPHCKPDIKLEKIEAGYPRLLCSSRPKLVLPTKTYAIKVPDPNDPQNPSATVPATASGGGYISIFDIRGCGTYRISFDDPTYPECSRPPLQFLFAPISFKLTFEILC